MPRGNRYQVKSNESLLQIAQGNNLSYQDLLKANPGINRVSTGQVVNLPNQGTGGGSAGFFSALEKAGRNFGNFFNLPYSNSGQFVPPNVSAGTTPPPLPNYGPGVVTGSMTSPNNVNRNAPSFNQIVNAGTEGLGLQGLGFPELPTGPGGGTDLYRPSTTARIDPKNSPTRLGALHEMLQGGKIPEYLTPYEANAIGFTQQDLIRSGYTPTPSGQYVYAGSEGTQGSGSGGNLRPGTLGYSVQANLAAGNKRKASQLQRYENYLNREKYSWTDKNRQKARRQRLKRKNQQETGLTKIGGYGLVDFNYRVATG